MCVLTPNVVGIISTISLLLSVNGIIDFQRDTLYRKLLKLVHF